MGSQHCAVFKNTGKAVNNSILIKFGSNPPTVLLAGPKFLSNSFQDSIPASTSKIKKGPSGAVHAGKFLRLA
jgi:hypothetical protein